MIQRLVHDATLLGVALTEHDAQRLLKLLAELERWNRTYNLTAITGQEAMISHHVLDSLAVHRYLHGALIADVGTGAGFPGLPLALVNPERSFTLIDSNGKKVRFVSHAAHSLGLMNVEAVHERVEQMEPVIPFSTVVARAFAPLPDLLAKVSGLVGPGTRVLAMQGKWPAAGIASLPARWQLLESHELTVPGLDAERSILILGRA